MSELIRVENLKKYFPVKGGMFEEKRFVHAVDNVSFTVDRGETLGFVGESGCGKSTCGRLLLRLLEPTSGKVFFEGKDIFELSSNEMRELRRSMQIVFQDPMACLNPRMRVKDIVTEPITCFEKLSEKDKNEKAMELMRIVGLSPEMINRYPHEFSGGQRQRIGIARAISNRPKFIVCDEPVSALDVSVQSQILNLLQDLQDEYALTYVFIAHGLNVIKHISTRIAVMYLGSIVEIGTRDEVFQGRLHPYTQALFSAIPIPDPTVERSRILLKTDIANPTNIPKGCRFASRCWCKKPICDEVAPELKEVQPGHFCACHLI